MAKKNDKRLCWSCEGNVSQHISQCPYCGVDLKQPRDEAAVKEFVSPFQSTKQKNVPQPPYAGAQNKNFLITEDEWNTALNAEKEQAKLKETLPSTKKEIIAFLLLLPGILFFLFALTLIFFSNEGVLCLRWNQNVAYFYFLGSIPLLYLSWRAFR